MTNPTPYYTATSPTAGPADTNASARGKLYARLAVITPLLGFLATFNIVTTEQGNAITGFITAAMGLLGVFGFGLAASKTNKQVKDGTFDPAPNAPVLDAFQSINAIKAHVDETVQQAQATVASAVGTIQGAVNMLPGGALVSGAVMSGPVGDLLQSMLDNPDRR